jgi:hypothetical protein
VHGSVHNQSIHPRTYYGYYGLSGGHSPCASCDWQWVIITASPELLGIVNNGAGGCMTAWCSVLDVDACSNEAPPLQTRRVISGTCDCVTA